jgi:hypothetical protein
MVTQFFDDFHHHGVVFSIVNLKRVARGGIA